jgi:alpha-1,3-glucosyltransferase
MHRFPKSLSYVILDALEKVYLAGFLLLAFTSLFPALMERRRISTKVCIPSNEFSCGEPEGQVGTGVSQTMEFLPLMLTSVYCAIGLVWGFLRLMFIYLHEETAYQGQLSGLR